MVESPAQRVAPMAVVGADGGGYGVRFRFKDDSRSVGIHDILQDACTCVVARYDEHPVGRHLRSEERRVGKECRSRWSPYH